MFANESVCDLFSPWCPLGVNAWPASFFSHFEGTIVDPLSLFFINFNASLFIVN